MKEETYPKIIIIGAGIGGLYLASLLGQDYEVILFEKKKRSQLGYPWFDAVDKDMLEKYEIRLQEKDVYPKQILSLHGPSGEGIFRQKENRSKNADIDRKALIRFLMKKAERRTKIYYGTTPDEILLKNGKVVGVRVGEKKFLSDLVVDSAGMMSPYKNSLPFSFLTKDKLQVYDYLCAYRATFQKKSEEESPSNVYLMPNQFTLLWCKDARQEGFSDVFISRFGTLTSDDIVEGIQYLQKNNPWLQKEYSSRVIDFIPLRPPTAVPVGNGYAVIGNSAFLTKPFSGSGIENALYSAKLLYKTILKCKTFDAKELWQYAFQLNLTLGSNCYCMCIMRSVLRKLTQEELVWIFNSGALTLLSDYIEKLDIYDFKSFSLEELFDKLKDVIGKKTLWKKISSIIRKTFQAMAFSASLSPVYDERRLRAWKRKYDEFWVSVNQ